MVRDELKAMSIAALKARDKETRTLLSGVLGRFQEVEKSGKFDGWTEQSQRELIAAHIKQLSSSLPLSQSESTNGARRTWWRTRWDVVSLFWRWSA